MFMELSNKSENLDITERLSYEIVYGSSLKALRFAKENNIKIVLDGLQFPIDYVEKAVKEEWSQLLFGLLLNGNSIGGDSFVSAKLTDEELFVICKGNVLNKVKYNKIYFFSDKNIIGLPSIEKANKEYLIIDQLNPIYLSKPHLSYIKTKDQLVSEIYINKLGYQKKIKIFSISTLQECQLHDFDYSDTMVKFKCEHLLKEYGFLGADKGKRYTHIKLEAFSRKVIKKMDFYRDTKRLKFFYD